MGHDLPQNMGRAGSEKSLAPESFLLTLKRTFSFKLQVVVRLRPGIGSQTVMYEWDQLCGQVVRSGFCVLHVREIQRVMAEFVSESVHMIHATSF